MAKCHTTYCHCAFLPLLKSSQKDPALTASYRAIAGSSLILKVFEKTILLLWGKLLSSDGLQFGYKTASSTTQASWLVHEVIGHYLREGSNPICGLLDCSKAFDLANGIRCFPDLAEENSRYNSQGYDIHLSRTLCMVPMRGSKVRNVRNSQWNSSRIDG